MQRTKSQHQKKTRAVGKDLNLAAYNTLLLYQYQIRAEKQKSALALTVQRMRISTARTASSRIITQRI